MRVASTKPVFDKQLSKLDPQTRDVILKRMQKIIENPELGKPLHAPQQNHFSERVEKHRIIYTFTLEEVIFVFIEHRDKVFNRAFQFYDKELPVVIQTT